MNVGGATAGGIALLGALGATAIGAGVVAGRREAAGGDGSSIPERGGWMVAGGAGVTVLGVGTKAAGVAHGAALGNGRAVQGMVHPTNARMGLFELGGAIAGFGMAAVVGGVAGMATGSRIAGE